MEQSALVALLDLPVRISPLRGDVLREIRDPVEVFPS